MFKTIQKLVAAALIALGLTTAQAQVSRIVPVNGTVNASVLNTATGILYIGGNFTAVNSYITGRGAIISTATGLPELGWPEVNGTVYASVSDGAGGWFIGGSFSQVGGVVRNNLAHINANKSVTGWNPNPNNGVYTLAVSGGIVYAGGLFTNVGVQPRNRLASFDAISGTVTGWNPDADNIVNTLAVSGGIVYAGGDFTTVAGAQRRRLASFDAISGTVTGWNPNADGFVNALAVSGGIVYAGGGFTNVGGQTRNRLASFDAISGTVTGWNPNSDGIVFTLAVSDGILYAGGGFSNVGGQTRNRLASFDALSGTVTVWNPNSNGGVYTLAVSGGIVYAGGDFTTVAGVERRRLASIDALSGTVTGWNPNASGQVNTLAVSGGMVYAGGGFSNVGGQTRNRLASFDALSGTVTGWNPNADNRVNTLAVSGGTVYAGGLFTTVGGETRNRLASIDAISGTVTGWNPNADNLVITLAVSGGIVYAGGAFTNVGGQTRNRLASIDALSGTVTGWNPNVANNFVSTLAVSGGIVYAGGNFTTVAGVTRNRLASIDAISGTVTGWNPNASGTVNTLAVSGGIVYAGGAFTNVGGQTRNRLASFDALSGTVTGWNPNVANSEVRTLAVSGGIVYAGGGFSTVGGQIRNGLASIDAISGTVTGWNPNANNVVWTLAVSGGIVYAGGQFSNLSGGTGGWVGLAPAYIARLDGAYLTQTITGLSSAINVVYGAANQSLGGVSSSALPIVYVSSNSALVSVSGSILAFKGAGVATITASNLGNNEYVAAQDVSFVVTVTSKSATISGANATKVYGEFNPIFTGTVLGLVNNDAISFAGITAATSLSGVGTYPITATISGSGLDNYSFVSQNSTLNVTSKSATISGANATKVYGELNPIFTGTVLGLVNNDAISFSGISAATSLSGVGTYPITATVSGSGLDNYSFVAQNASLSVTSKSATISGANATKVYGELNPIFTGTVLGLVNNDAISFSGISAATSLSSVGIYPITATVSGAGLGNYSFVAQNASLSVSSKSATISGANATKVYGEVNPIFTGTVLGLVNNDAISFSNPTTSATSLSGVGTYPITATVSGAGLDNYSFVAQNGILTILPSVSTVTILGASVNGVLTSATSITISCTGFENGATITVNGVSISNFTVVNGNTITATIPAGTLLASNNVILVQNPNQVASSNSPVVITDVTLSVNYELLVMNYELTIYPNPSTGTFTVVGGKGIKVFDIIGNLILKTNESSFAISSKGLFIAQVETENGVEYIKLVVE